MPTEHDSAPAPKLIRKSLEGGGGELRRRALDRLRSMGGPPREWSNAAGDRYGKHSHGYYKVLFCLEGSIEFSAGDLSFELTPGDRLDLPEGTPHSAVVGPDGVVCVEAPLPHPPDADPV